MSDSTLRALIQRINDNDDFRSGVLANPAGALADLGLSATERAAIAASSEDTLRRMAGADVAGYAKPRRSDAVICRSADSTCYSACYGCITR
jgi:hypothetical protein